MQVYLVLHNFKNKENIRALWDSIQKKIFFYIIGVPEREEGRREFFLSEDGVIYPDLEARSSN